MHLAFEDEREEVTTMAAVKPSSSSSSAHRTHDAAAAKTMAVGQRRDHELRSTPELAPASPNASATRDAYSDSNEAATPARGVAAAIASEDEPETLARTPSIHAAETRRQLEDVGRGPLSTPIVEADIATLSTTRDLGKDISTPTIQDDLASADAARDLEPRTSSPVFEQDVTTLTKAARELDTLPRGAKKLVLLDERTARTAATTVKRESIPPPDLPSTPDLPPTLPPQAPHTGSFPWIASMPPVDPSPSPETRIRTPLAMVTTAEDNLTRVAPLSPPVLRKPLDPLPPSHAEPAGKVPLPRIGLAAAALLLVGVLSVVAIRPRANGAAAARGSAPSPVAVTAETPPVVPPIASPPSASPPSASPPVASPPIASPPMASPPIAAAPGASPPVRSPSPKASASPPAQRPTVRSEPRRRGPAKATGRGARAPIPLRRAP